MSYCTTRTLDVISVLCMGADTEVLSSSGILSVIYQIVMLDLSAYLDL